MVLLRPLRPKEKSFLSRLAVIIEKYSRFLLQFEQLCPKKVCKLQNKSGRRAKAAADVGSHALLPARKKPPRKTKIQNNKTLCIEKERSIWMLMFGFWFRRF